MAKAKKLSDGQVLRLLKKKPTKSERTRPGGRKTKRYRGQGRI